MKHEVEVKSFTYDLESFYRNNREILKNKFVEEVFCYLIEKIRRLEASVFTFATARLNERQKVLLKELAKIVDNGKRLTLTSIGRILSSKLKLSESTVKWNLREFRNMGLIIAGNVNSKGTYVRLTDIGQIIAKGLLNGDSGTINANFNLRNDSGEGNGKNSC